MTGTAAARRYALLNALLWLPAGLYLVPLVLLMLERGLPVSTIAAVGIVYGLTTAVLELPTGGLADVLGRRPVLIAPPLVQPDNPWSMLCLRSRPRRSSPTPRIRTCT